MWWYVSICIRIFMCVDICVYRYTYPCGCVPVCEPDVIRNHCRLLSTSHTEAVSHDERGTHHFGWCSSLLAPETPVSTSLTLGLHVSHTTIMQPFTWAFGIQTSSTHTCTVSTSLADPSPELAVQLSSTYYKAELIILTL